MTLAELKSLVETMQNLPCVVNQLEEVQVRSYVTLIKVTSKVNCVIQNPSKIDKM